MKLAAARAARRALGFFADHAPVPRRRPFQAGRDTAPSGVPARRGFCRVGGEGTRLRCARGARVVLRGCGSLISQFFALLFRPPFFVASVVAPPECAIYGTNQFFHRQAWALIPSN